MGSRELKRIGEYSEENFAIRKSELSENSVVRRPIERLDKDVGRSHVGRKLRFTPTTLRNAVNKYFKWCEDSDEIPSIKGLTIYLKIYKDTFYKYMNRPEFSDILEHARLIISNWVETDIYNTKGIAAGKIAYVKNVHGWTDKIESTNTEVRVDLTPEMARAKIEMLAPKLLEVLNNNFVLDQLTSRSEVTSLVRRDEPVKEIVYSPETMKEEQAKRLNEADRRL